MFKIIKRIVLALYKYTFCRLNPVKYARSLGVTVGEGVKFYSPNYNMFSTEPWLITIGNNVYITAGVTFLTHDNGTLIARDEIGDFTLTGNITIEDNVVIGIRSVILLGTTIGEHSIIGCCSVVTKDIPKNSVAVGVPCKVIKTTDSYINKIKDVIAGNNPRYYSDIPYMFSLRNKKSNKTMSE